MKAGGFSYRHFVARSDTVDSPNDVVSTLTIETGSGFIQEKQELGLGGQFYSDGETLPALDRETESGETDHGIGEILQLEELKDFLDVVVFLFFRNRSGLTKVGTVSHGLSHGGSPFL